MEALQITFEERHQWLEGLIEDTSYPGFYDTTVSLTEEQFEEISMDMFDMDAAVSKLSKAMSNPVRVVLDVPNRVKLVRCVSSPAPSSSTKGCAHMKERASSPALNRRQRAKDAATYDVYISSFPCKLEMIAAN